MSISFHTSNSISTIIAGYQNVRWGTNPHTYQFYLHCTKCVEHEWVSQFMEEASQLETVAEFCEKHRHEETKKVGFSNGQVDVGSFITSSVQARFDVNQELILAIAKLSNFNVNYQQNGFQLRLFCGKCKATLHLNRALTMKDVEDNTTAESKFCDTHAHRMVTPVLTDGRKFREDEL